MSDQIFSIEDIERQARMAADAGKDVSACRYMDGTDEDRIWKRAYHVRMYELSGESTA